MRPETRPDTNGLLNAARDDEKRKHPPWTTPVSALHLTTTSALDRPRVVLAQCSIAPGRGHIARVMLVALERAAQDWSRSTAETPRAEAATTPPAPADE